MTHLTDDQPIQPWQHPHEPPPARVPAAFGSRCVYFSTVDQDSINRMAELGPGYTALFSADLNLSQPGRDYYVTGEQLQQLRAAGVTVASWCDCSETPYSYALQMKLERGLMFAGGQAESPEQYRQATRGGCHHIVGEPSNLKADQEVFEDAIRRSNDGTLAFIGEVMHPDPTYSAQGVNITSACFYVDRDAKEGGYLPLAAYAAMPKSLRDACSVYTGGRMTGGDYMTYQHWTKR